MLIYVQEAKDLLQNLEKLQLQQNEVITPPPPADDDVEETTEPPSKKPRIRKKRSKAVLGAEDVGKEKATPEKQRPKAKPSSRSPPLSGGATSSGNNRVVDAGEDAQPTFPSDSLPTAFQSTQKVFTPTRSAPKTGPETETSSPKPASSKKTPKASQPKLPSPKPSPKASFPNRSAVLFPTPKASPPKRSASPKPSPKASPPKLPATGSLPKPKDSPRKSLLCSFDNAEDPPPEQVHVFSLDPAPEFASETDDELLKYALHLNMVEVSSAEEDCKPTESRMHYGSTNGSMLLQLLYFACIPLR